MIGILHIVVARKPLEGTVAQNCLAWGCGAININACRIGVGTGKKEIREYPDIRSNNYGQNKADYASRNTVTREVIDQGRWPANLILGHGDGCTHKGTMKITGSVPTASGFDRLNKKQAALGYRPGEYQKGEVEPGYCHTDVEGKETVEVWECIDDCSVKILGEQSGKSGAGLRVEKKSGRKDESQYRIKTGTIKDFGDTGTAARFFFNYTEQESSE
jgi:hypothetical protein